MKVRAAAKVGIDFDPERLRKFLHRHLPELHGEMSIERIGGGQSNPTYFLTCGDQRLVLRKQPNGDLPKSAHDVAREYRIISALSETNVPVPTPVLLHDAADVVGTPFYLMERLDGVVFMDQSLAGIDCKERREYFREFAQSLATLHSVNWRSTDLASLARSGRFLDRQVDRWTRAWGEEVETDATLSRLVGWLRANIPDEEATAIVHGDFKLTNVMFALNRPSIIGVLDWELCAIGDPLTDLGHIWSTLWNTKPDEYGGLMGLDLEAMSLPSAEEFLADYYATSQSSLRLTPFYKALAHFRNAGIFHGIGERAVVGNANAADAGEVAKLDRVYLQRAVDIAVANGA